MSLPKSESYKVLAGIIAFPFVWSSGARLLAFALRGRLRDQNPGLLRSPSLKAFPSCRKTETSITKSAKTSLE